MHRLSSALVYCHVPSHHHHHSVRDYINHYLTDTLCFLVLSSPMCNIFERGGGGRKLSEVFTLDQLSFCGHVYGYRCAKHRILSCHFERGITLNVVSVRALGWQKVAKTHNLRAFNCEQNAGCCYTVLPLRKKKKCLKEAALVLTLTLRRCCFPKKMLLECFSNIT